MTPDASSEAVEQLRLRYWLAAAADVYFEAGFTVALEGVVARNLLGEYRTMIRGRHRLSAGAGNRALGLDRGDSAGAIVAPGGDPGRDKQPARLGRLRGRHTAAELSPTTLTTTAPR